MNNRGMTLEEFEKIESSLLLMKEQSITMSNENNKIFFDMCDNINQYSTSKEKGNKLEDLIFFIIKNTPIFEGYQNIRSSTNEVDIFVRLSDIGNLMLSNKLLDLKSSEIIIECKNYDERKIDVTWVGKFCSLLLHSPARVGLLISHRGFKGIGKWDSSKGLAKKFFYYKERFNDKQYVLDITLDEIKESVKNNSFVELILSKIIGLENDTRYEQFLTNHPAESELNKMN